MPKPKSVLRKIPKFKSEEDERKFWETADSADYVDWSKASKVYLADRVAAERGRKRRQAAG